MDRNKRDLSCKVCGDDRLKIYFTLGVDTYWECRRCGLVQMWPHPQRMAPGDDYQGYDLDKQRKFVQLFLVPRYRYALHLIQSYQSGGRLLDVGCGTGEFMDEAARAGFSVFGVEPSKTAFLIAKQKHPVVRGELEDIGLKASSFNVVTLWSVLEHILDPFSFLMKIRFILEDEGILALRLPSSRGVLPLAALGLYRTSAGRIRRPLAAIYQLKWHYKHFYCYHPKNLGLLLKKCGFSILHIEEDSSFDLVSLDYRMDYLPRSPALRILLKAALFLILQLSQLLQRQDELLVIARKSA